MNVDGKRAVLERNDPALHSLLSAADCEERQRRLEELFVTRVRPIIDRIVATHLQLHRGLAADTLEDVASTIMVRLMTRLETLGRSSADAIRRFDDYVIIVSRNVVHDFLRRRYPERTRLVMRLRYALTHDPRLAMWHGLRGALCGLAVWGESMQLAAGIDLHRAATQRVVMNQDRPADALTKLFRQAAGPLPFLALVDAIATLWNIEENPVDRSQAALVERHEGVTETLRARELMRAVWDEIAVLPARQRAALLLNLRDGQGRNALMLFALTNVATFSDIAEAVGLAPEALAEVWNDLPLDDLRIAEWFGITRQQVINLRKSARERLGRRLAMRERT
jgi:RNA polymerase sigma factor (sigma-70 family)